jgi:hypothetical protein
LVAVVVVVVIMVYQALQLVAVVQVGLEQEQIIRSLRAQHTP